jgi:hypothetical protein
VKKQKVAEMEPTLLSPPPLAETAKVTSSSTVLENAKNPVAEDG